MLPIIHYLSNWLWKCMPRGKFQYQFSYTFWIAPWLHINDHLNCYFYSITFSSITKSGNTSYLFKVSSLPYSTMILFKSRDYFSRQCFHVALDVLEPAVEQAGLNLTEIHGAEIFNKPSFKENMLFSLLAWWFILHGYNFSPSWKFPPSMHLH